MPGLRQRPVHSIALQGRYAIEPPIDQEEFHPITARDRVEKRGVSVVAFDLRRGSRWSGANLSTGFR